MAKTYKDISVDEAESLIELGVRVVWTRDCWDRKVHYICAASPKSVSALYEKSLFPAILQVEVE